MSHAGSKGEEAVLDLLTALAAVNRWTVDDTLPLEEQDIDRAVVVQIRLYPVHP